MTYHIQYTKSYRVKQQCIDLLQQTIEIMILKIILSITFDDM